MEKRLLMIAAFVICFSLGGIAGATIVLHEWDVMAMKDTAERQANITEWQKINGDVIGAAQQFQNQLAACEAKFNTGTVLYGEKIGPPLLVGLPFLRIPTGELGPQWIIPAKIKPIFLGDPRAIRYYYFDPKTKRLDGPFLPEIPSSPDAQQ
jgi:hypothetical protein